MSTTLELWQGDCLDLMGRIPDGSVDLIAADLPYGTTACKWDTVIPFAPLWAHYRRVLKPRGAVVLTASQPFTSTLVMSNPRWFRYCWVWEKQNPTGHLDARRRPMKAHEDIAVFSRSAPRYFPQGLKPVCVKNGRKNKNGHGVYGRIGNPDYVTNEGNFPRSVLRIPRDTHGQIHGTQKPVALFEYLIRTYSNPGDLVLDNTCGSATTLIACLNTGRRGIGIEKDPEIFQTARRRVNAREAELSELLIPA